MSAERTFVVASHRPWNRELSSNLSRKLGHVFVPIGKREELSLQMLERISPERIFFPHWSWIVSPEIFERFECIVFHMTDLPYGRGGSPLQNLIVRGIEETKITALRMTKEVDAGPIFLKRNLALHGSAEEIFIRASDIIEAMIEELILQNPLPVEQKGEAVTFARRTPEQGTIESASNLREVYDLIRMLDADGYPSAFLDVGPFRLEFSRASMKVGEVYADVRIKVKDES